MTAQPVTFRAAAARVLVLLCVAWCDAFGQARAADDDAQDKAQRRALDAERAAARTRYEGAVRACESSFAVTGCINQAKAERRVALDRVAREQATLDDVLRKRRAEDRRQRIAQKQQAVAARGAASAPPVQVRAPRQTSPAATAPRPIRRVEPRSAEDEAAAAAQAAERQAQAQRRRDKAAAHAQGVQQRNAERAAHRAPAAPLPAPSAPARASRRGAAAPANAPAASAP